MAKKSIAQRASRATKTTVIATAYDRFFDEIKMVKDSFERHVEQSHFGDHCRTENIAKCLKAMQAVINSLDKCHEVMRKAKTRNGCDPIDQISTSLCS